MGLYADSNLIICKNEIETDLIWKQLSDCGTILIPLDKYEWSEKFGWMQDRFRLSWQIVPKALHEMLSHPDKEKTNRITLGILKMKKI